MLANFVSFSLFGIITNRDPELLLRPFWPRVRALCFLSLFYPKFQLKNSVEELKCWRTSFFIQCKGTVIFYGYPREVNGYRYFHWRFLDDQKSNRIAIPISLYCTEMLANFVAFPLLGNVTNRKSDQISLLYFGKYEFCRSSPLIFIPYEMPKLQLKIICRTIEITRN